MRGSNNVTSRQIALFTFVAQTGIGITTLPTILAKEVGHDGWISVIVAGAAAILASIMIGILLRRYDNKSIFEINNLIFGRIIGSTFNTVLVSYLVLSASASVRVFSLFLRLTLLPRSHPLLMSPFVLLPSIYLLWLGLKNVCRFKYISIMSYVTAVLYLTMISKDVRISFLMPIAESGAMPILYSVRLSILSFIGLELVAFIYPEIVDKSKAFKWHVAASLLSTVFLTIVVAVSTAVFGENLIQTFTIPLFNLARIYHAPVIERVDLYITALWFVAMGCSMRAYMFVGFHSIQKVFGIQKTKGLLILFFAVIIAISRIPKDVNDVYLFLRIMNFSGVGVIGFIILCLLLSFISTKGVNTVESS